MRGALAALPLSSSHTTRDALYYYNTRLMASFQDNLGEPVPEW